MLTFLLIISTFSLLVKVRSGLLLLFWLYYFTIFINKCQYFLIFLICLTLLDNGLICFYSRKPCVSISVSIILIRNIMKFHITTRQNKKNIVIYMLYILGCSQAVRQMALTHRCVGSNPTTPAKIKVFWIILLTFQKTLNIEISIFGVFFIFIIC